MITARLIGHEWATRKYDALAGMKLMLVEEIGGVDHGRRLVAVDAISAGIGDRVLVSTGSAAWRVLELDQPNDRIPVDAVIVAIIDEDCPIEDE